MWHLDNFDLNTLILNAQNQGLKRVGSLVIYQFKKEKELLFIRQENEESRVGHMFRQSMFHL